MERQIFMCINIARAAPGPFSEVVKLTKHKNPRARNANFTINLIKTMHAMGNNRLPPVKMNDTANQACRQNNDYVVQRQEQVPITGGNIAFINKMVAEPVVGEEFTLNNVANAQEFVALQLILDWGREGVFAKQSPILKREVLYVGVSVKPHRFTTNLA